MTEAESRKASTTEGGSKHKNIFGDRVGKNIEGK